jgi:hypothetical protein
MSISGISPYSNNYLLYLLQRQQSQITTGQASSAGTSQVLLSTQSFFDDSEASAEIDDGTYSPSSVNGGAQGPVANFWSDLVSLLEDTQSGDTTSAQTAAGAVADDLGSLAATLAQGTTGPSDGTASTTSDAGSFLSDVGSLISAVQSGDITSAQSAADAVIQDLQSIAPPPSAVSSGAATQPSSDALTTFINDLSTLLEATSSGDLTSAQSAATKVESDLQSLAQQSDASSATPASNTATSASTDSSTDPTDTLANEVAQKLFNFFQNASAG